MVVFWVSGICGSGKTHIINMVGIECHNTDNIVRIMKEKLIKEKKFENSGVISKIAFMTLLMYHCNKYVEDVIKSSKKEKKDVLFEGSTLEIKGADIKYFIKLEKNEIEIVYKRLILRELNKFENNLENIRNHVNNSDMKLIHFYMRDYLPCKNFMKPISGYIKDYENMLREARWKKCKIMSQKDIVDDIKKHIKKN